MKEDESNSCGSAPSFRQRLLQREPLIGTFQKTPSSIVAEVLGHTSLDVVCIDAEHSPFGRLELDASIFALRAMGMPSLVRVPSGAPADVLNALDCGATGVVIPHVCTADDARAVAKAARFGRGGRGYAGSTRAAAYTCKPMSTHQADSLADTSVIAQIEDIEGVEAIDEIAAVEGIDCLFVGRIDLTVALGAEGPNAPEVLAAVERVCEAGAAANKPVGMFVPSMDEIAEWRKKGASLFLLSSDHSFMLQGAKSMVQSFRA